MPFFYTEEKSMWRVTLLDVSTALRPTQETQKSVRRYCFSVIRRCACLTNLRKIRPQGAPKNNKVF